MITLDASSKTVEGGVHKHRDGNSEQENLYGPVGPTKWGCEASHGRATCTTTTSLDN